MEKDPSSKPANPEASKWSLLSKIKFFGPKSNKTKTIEPIPAESAPVNQEQPQEEEPQPQEQSQQEEPIQEEPQRQSRTKTAEYLFSQKTQYLRRQRVQEIVERDLNSRLTKIDDLETAVLAEEPGISKEYIPFEGKEIPVYTLSGLPFSMLQTTINYRSPSSPSWFSDIGKETAKSVMENPAIWAQNLSEAEQSSGFGTRDSNARGDTISASYVESEYNMDDCVDHITGEETLIYGFENIEADSIIGAFNVDAATNNMAGKEKTLLHSPNAIDELTEPKERSDYNEVFLRRYHEGGKAKLPNYIIVRGDHSPIQIPEVALRHAAYFGIPIIRIDMSVYRERGEQKREEILESITENDNYVDITKKLDEAMRITPYRSRIEQREDFMHEPLGYRSDMPYAQPDKISKIEQRKRLDFIIEKLQEAIAFESSATETTDSKTPFSECDEFYVSAKPYHGRETTVSIDFQIKGSPRRIKTTIINLKEEIESGSLSTPSDASYDETLLEYHQKIRQLAKDYEKLCFAKMKSPGKYSPKEYY